MRFLHTGRLLLGRRAFGCCLQDLFYIWRVRWRVSVLKSNESLLETRRENPFAYLLRLLARRACLRLPCSLHSWLTIGLGDNYKKTLALCCIKSDRSQGNT
jgi:hypothetical protein